MISLHLVLLNSKAKNSGVNVEIAFSIRSFKNMYWLSIKITEDKLTLLKIYTGLSTKIGVFEKKHITLWFFFFSLSKILRVQIVLALISVLQILKKITGL